MHRTDAKVLKAAIVKNAPPSAVCVGGTTRVSVLALERDTKPTAWVCVARLVGRFICCRKVFFLQLVRQPKASCLETFSVVRVLPHYHAW
jgi:hypothetical protein